MKRKKEAIKKQSSLMNKWKKKILLHDNARSLVSKITVEKFRRLEHKNFIISRSRILTKSSIHEFSYFLLKCKQLLSDVYTVIMKKRQIYFCLIPRLINLSVNICFLNTFSNILNLKNNFEGMQNLVVKIFILFVSINVLKTNFY